MLSAKLTSRGRLVVPKEVRDLLSLREGDRINFVIGRDGQVVIRPAILDIRALRGLLARRDGPRVSVDEMSSAVCRRASGG